MTPAGEAVAPGIAEDALQALLGLHVLLAIGSVVLLPLPWIAPKGGALHVRSGRLFLFLLRGTLATACALLALEAAGPGAPDSDLLEALEPLSGGRGRLFAILLGLAATTWAAAHVGLLRIRARGCPRTTRTALLFLLGGQLVVFASAPARPLASVALLGAAAAAFLVRLAKEPALRPAHAAAMAIACLGLVATLLLVLAHRYLPEGLDERSAWILVLAAGASALAAVRTTWVRWGSRADPGATSPRS